MLATAKEVSGSGGLRFVCEPEDGYSCFSQKQEVEYFVMGKWRTLIRMEEKEKFDFYQKET